jgi:hypothetical protein
MKFFRDLVLTVLTCVALILILEAGLRLAHDRYDASLFQPEPERGFSLRPHAEGWNVTGGETFVRINGDGMRDRERPVQRPPDTLRVAVIGASNAEAREVPLEQTFEQVLERKLAPDLRQRGKHVDVLNFGVTGYTFAQQYLTLRDHVWRYDPQIVVVIWDQYLLLKNTLKTDPPGPEGDRMPFYIVRNGRLEPAEPTHSLKLLRSSDPRQTVRRNLAADWMNHSNLLSMVNWARVQLQRQMGIFNVGLRRELPGGKASAASGSARPDDYLQWWPYLGYKPEMQEDWEIGEAFAREMKAECDRHGAEFWIVISDTEMQSNPSLALRNSFMRRRGLSSLDQADQRLEEFCQKNGIRIVRLAAPLGDYAVAHQVGLHGEAGHWNKLGNEIVGRALADEFRSRSSVVQAWESEHN